MRAASPYRRTGFTLVEMVVVLAVLGLVLGVLGSQRPMRSARLELDGAARALTGTLQLARSRAIAENRVVAVTIGPASYAYDGGAPQPLPARVVARDVATIAFAANGSSSGGTIALQAGDRVAMVTVEWLTGRVSTTGLR
jgi:prepilin-type N-terminal cleavage/methylation domain-containing protein